MSLVISAKTAPRGVKAPLPVGRDAARSRLSGLPRGGPNFSREAVERHVADGHSAQSVLIWLGRDGTVPAGDRGRDRRAIGTAMGRSERENPHVCLTQGTISVASLGVVAPDLDPGQIGEVDHLQNDLGLDTMDFLSLVSALNKGFALPILEADYPRLATTVKATAYLEKMLAA